jgi:RNA polymerase primary sigma factor
VSHSDDHKTINLALHVLAERADLQGWLTQEDVLEIYPAAAGDNDQLSRMIAALRLKGIDVIPQEKVDEPDVELALGDPEALVAFEYVASDDTVSLYLKETALTPLLSMEEELVLAKRIARARQAKRELIRVVPSESDPEICRELDTLIRDGRLARDALIKANTRLVVSVARRYLGRGVPLLDLIQEGNLGLMKAVEKYEYQRGFRFSTYATWWIRQGIVRAIADQGRTIRVPVHMVDRLRMVHKASRELEQKIGRAPTAQELAERLDLDSSKLNWLLQVTQQPVSLETPVSGEEDTELGMYVEDITSPSPAQITYENMLRERLDEVLGTLTPREARILRLRFGLGQDRPYTLEEVGQKFGLTRERIRQIESKALRRLRQPSRARLLRDYS